MGKTINRIVEFIRYKGMSVRQFDISIGAANGYTLRMEKNNASVGSDVIERINKEYPNLNLVWLITGKGPMLNEDLEKERLDKLDLDDFITDRVKEKWSEEKKELLSEIMTEIKEKF